MIEEAQRYEEDLQGTERLHDRELADFINVWIELKKRDRTIDTLYDYWILGKNAVPKQPHWSVLRNVLQWVK